jgi:hypothetical protein
MSHITKPFLSTTRPFTKRYRPFLVVLGILAATVAPSAWLDWTDDPLVSGTPIRLRHIIELRNNINEIRTMSLNATCVLGPVDFDDPDPSVAPPRLIHINQLTTAVSDTYAVLGIAPPTLPAIKVAGDIVFATDFNLVRRAMDDLVVRCGETPAPRRTFMLPSPTLGGTWSVISSNSLTLQPSVTTEICTPTLTPQCRVYESSLKPLSTGLLPLFGGAVPLHVADRGGSLVASYRGPCNVGQTMRTCAQTLNGTRTGDEVLGTYSLEVMFGTTIVPAMRAEYDIVGTVERTATSTRLNANFTSRRSLGDESQARTASFSFNDHTVTSRIRQDLQSSIVFDITECRADTDGDALCDEWETDGIRDEGGNMLLDLASLGSNPAVPDVFLEMDYMLKPSHNHQPKHESVEAVKQAFLDAGKVLRLDVDKAEAVPEIAAVRFRVPGPGAQDDFDDIKNGTKSDPCDGFFGTREQRNLANCSDVLEARSLVYRYVLFGHNFIEDGITVGNSGQAELPGNDFIVTLGAHRVVNKDTGEVVSEDQPFWDSINPRNRVQYEAGTLMHELGHTLGLGHGGRGPDGPDHTNCKPNYLSVMSYSRQFASLIANRRLDYSRWETELITLRPESLRPADGITLNNVRRGELYRAEVVTLFGVHNGYEKADAWGAISWKPSDVSEVVSNVYLHRPSIKKGCLKQTAVPELVPRNDWARLQYNFRSSPDFEDGMARQTVSSVPEQTERDVFEEASTFDFDGDAIFNAFDVCPATFDPDQRDTDGNGVGDACEPRPPDTTPPTLSLPANIVVNATAPGGAAVTFAASASDAVDGALPVTCTPPSGVMFAVGATTVLCSAVDSQGNRATGTFSVTVRALAIPGDLDANGRVDCADVLIVRASYGKRTGQAGFDPRADVVRNGLVNLADLTYVSSRLPSGTVCR